jgi:coenzyme F420-reducing hydrogenase delta subunit
MADLRETIQAAGANLKGTQRVLVFGCEGSEGLAGLADHQTAVIDLVCMAQMPPAFMDFVLSRDLADGILLAGCSSADCQYRFGALWTEHRIGRERDPRLRKRVSAEQIAMAWLTPWKDCGGVPQILHAFRESLSAPDEPADSPEAPIEPAWKPRRIAVQAMAWGLFAVATGVLSVWPSYQLLEPGHAVVSLTFSHAGQRISECRLRTQKELDELPPNMRKPSDCPRGRLPVYVEFNVDGQNVYRESVDPSGLWKDGESTIYRRFRVDSGTRRLAIGMRDSSREAGFDFEHEEQVRLADGQHLVAEFDHTGQKFIFR